MIKVLGLFRKKPGMTREAFVDRYENPEYGHAQFAIKLCPWLEDYRRNFICDTSPFPELRLPGAGKRPSMDVVMMTTARDAAQADLTVKALADPAVGEMIARDEEALFDRTRMTILNVDERTTPLESLKVQPAGCDGPPPIKVLEFAAMADPSQSREEFAVAYEELVEFIVSKLREDGESCFAGYRRNYVDPAAFANYEHVKTAPPKPDFDVMSELWFWSADDLRSYLAGLAGPAGAAIANAQSRVINPASLNQTFVDECIHTPEMLEAAMKAHEEMKRLNG